MYIDVYAQRSIYLCVRARRMVDASFLYWKGGDGRCRCPAGELMFTRNDVRGE